MKLGYIRDSRPWSIADQARKLVDYGCQSYWVEGPSYHDQTEWLKLVSDVRPADEIVVASLLVFGETAAQVNEALLSIADRGATLTNWVEVFHPQSEVALLPEFQWPPTIGKQALGIGDSDLADRIRETYVREGWSVTDISDHFLLPESHVRELLFL